MITLLYRDCLVIATVEKLESVYKVGAIIFFNDIRIEEADNGKGVYSGGYSDLTNYSETNYDRHTMPYSTILLENSI